MREKPINLEELISALRQAGFEVEKFPSRARKQADSRRNAESAWPQKKPNVSAKEPGTQADGLTTEISKRAYRAE